MAFRFLLLLAVLTAAIPLKAQEPQRVRRMPSGATVPSAPLSEAMRGAVVEEIARQLTARYVFPETGQRLADHLRSRQRAGAFAALTDAGAFADTLTRQLRTVTPDLHLSVLAPGALQARLGPPREQGPEAFREALADREAPLNHYFRAVEVLAGNVGYLALDQFAGSEAARATAAAAMAFLAHTDALILDFRQNPGGMEGMNQFLSSYFFPADTSLVLYTRYNRERDATTAYRVLPDVPGERRPTIPLYVLVARGTGSSAENMAYALQARGRATLVGQTTAGAANSARPVVLPHGFGMLLPFARVISPVTGTNWEGVGVVPDVAVEPAHALATAHAHALRTLAAQASSPEARAALEATRAGVEARLRPAPAAESLARYVGRYGDRTLRVEDGALVLQRDGGPPFQLLPLENGLFALENMPAARLRAEQDAGGAVVAIEVLQPSGVWTRSPRTVD